MKISRWTLPAALILALCLALLPVLAGGADQKDGGAAARTQPKAYLAKLDGPVSPAMVQFCRRTLKKAAEEKAGLVIYLLDTPGGLVDSMRAMVKDMLASPVPVAVFVAPQGARAASAGVMITLAGHIAAMAPGTNIGAASVVAAGGGEVKGTMARKVTNDMIAFVRSVAAKHGRNADWAEKAVRYAVSLPAIEAAAEGVVDVVAPDLDALLEWADGRRVNMESGQKTLHTKGMRVVELEPNFRDRVLAVIANPNLAYLLLMLGFLGIFLELTHPGVILPGVVGAISVLLAMFAMQTLSVSVTGLLMLVLGVVLFIIELKVISYGLLSVGGIACLFFGSVMLFESPEGVRAVSWSVILPTVGLVSAFFLAVVWLVFRAQLRKPVTGLEGLTGTRGRVLEWRDKSGKVFIHGEIWAARAEEALEPDQEVVVVSAEGLILGVAAAENTQAPPGRGEH